MRKLGPDEEAIMWVRIRSARGVNSRQAGDVAGDARSVAAKYPNSEPVLVALTEAEFDDQQFDAAERAADRALAIDPNSVKAMLYKGRVHLERAKKNPQEYEAARTWFAKANRTDPDDASALFEYYRTYAKQGVTPPPMAVAGLERAFAIAPYDSDIRMVLARELLVEKKGTFARQVLMPLALAPHESQRGKALNAVAGLIKNGQLDEALKKLDERMAKEEEEKKKGD
jgi:tetratricopeptide (TPR) repeat protein